ncbi:MAG: CDP-diacylglycerol--glycerol-3-phosphate 3-phosphatidyltransferase [Chloroflexi bacterium]|nr:CDP-diacylglycerol--glycerol-3-phosphate 3-phosphatidyltransferase [Chloroflexota bacterium]|tara:strand:+ start:28134 stop:28691 length:558 start_codon:yes stop_codon:yes gene_type:complete
MINFPTVLTISRFIFAIFVSVLLFFNSNLAVIIALILFILGSLSDALDGAFARRRSSQSKFGAFLDPIADKFLVFLVLISLVYQRESTIIFVITILIISREIFIMSLREWMANSLNGKTLEVSSLGKTKTILQMTGISMVIATPIIPLSYYFELSIVVLIIGTLFGYFSAFKYFKESFSNIKLFI